jgi:hypothetical protein
LYQSGAGSIPAQLAAHRSDAKPLLQAFRFSVGPESMPLANYYFKHKERDAELPNG